jgi:hypothetical protein
VIRYDGKPRGHVRTIADGGAGVSAPAITGIKAGWFVVAWTHPGWSKQAIYVRRFRADGLGKVRRVAAFSPRRLFDDPHKHVVAHADEPVLGFDFKRLQTRLAWNVQAFSGRKDAGAIAAVRLEGFSQERLGKPALLAEDPPGTGASYELRMFERDRAPSSDVVWWHIDQAGDCFDMTIRHRLVALPWHAVGDGPQTLSSPDDPSGPPDHGCKPYADHPALAGTYSDAPNMLYVWERPPYILGVVR